MSEVVGKMVLTGRVKEQVEKLVVQANEINKAINTYVQGVIDSKEMDGVWMLDPKEMALIKKED